MPVRAGLLAGIVHAARTCCILVDHHTVKELSPVNTLALALDLRWRAASSCAVSSLQFTLRQEPDLRQLEFQTSTVMIFMGGVLLLLSRFSPSVRQRFTALPLFGVASAVGRVVGDAQPVRLHGHSCRRRAPRDR